MCFQVNVLYSMVGCCVSFVFLLCFNFGEIRSMNIFQWGSIYIFIVFCDVTSLFLSYIVFCARKTKISLFWYLLLRMVFFFAIFFCTHTLNQAFVFPFLVDAALSGFLVSKEETE